MKSKSENEELEKLKHENKYLRKLLGIPSDFELIKNKNKIVTRVSSVERKINLFRSLFKGREDVYATRWESYDKSGYSPVCANKGKKGKCNLPYKKCRECKNREYKYLDDDVIYDHLAGENTVGIYAILNNDKCNFLAVDFDKKNWKKDITAFVITCNKLKIPASIEVSRSGKGGHVWIFFAEEIPAIIARKLGSHIISETMRTGKLMDMESYDRMFPNQDFLPVGGFGNLIALPLQKKPREYGCSVFVDANFRPYPDQWSYLSLINKVSLLEVQNSISETIEIPIVKVNRNMEVEVLLSNQIYINKTGLPKYLYYKIIQLAIFSNPAFYIAQSSRRTTHNIPKFIKCYSNFPKMISIPIGLLDKLLKIFKENNITYKVEDNRNCGKKIYCNFKGTLFPKQLESLKEILKKDTSVLCASTGFGKTVLAIKIISVRQVSTLILVHRLELLNQWKEKLQVFSDGSNIGVIKGSKFRPTFEIDIAMIQTLKNYPMSKLDRYGQIIVDECHHIAAYTFERILKKTGAKYILGMTATPKRKDGHHPIVFMQCGDVSFRSNIKLSFESMNVYKIHTDWIRIEIGSTLASIVSTMIKDFRRNKLICDEVVRAVNRGRKVLILTERVHHLKILENMLTPFCSKIIVLKGKMKKKEKEKVDSNLSAIKKSDKFLILATGSYIGEGFDFPLLDTMFLALPVSWKGTLQQYIGRIVRSHTNKKTIEIYDYVDINIERIERMYNKRKKAYKNLGFKIISDDSLEYNINNL